MGTITYGDKVAINENTSVADINKVNASDMNEIKTAVNDNNSNITTLQTQIAGLKGTILWTNSSPSATFSSKTITLSSSDYDILEVYFKPVYNQTLCNSARMIKGNGTVMMITNAEYGAITMFVREITRNSDTSFTIGTGYAVGTTKNQNNNVCVPLYIVGYKTGVF